MSPEIPLHTPAPRRRLLWLRRVVLFGLLPLAALAGIVKWGIAPWAVRRHVSAWFAERTHARLEIGWANVGFREIRLTGLRLTDRGGRAYGTADAVVIRLDRPFAGFGKPVIESLRIIRPDVSVTLEPDGHFDIQKILRRPPAPSTAAASAPAPAGTAPNRLPPTIDVEGGILRFNTAFLWTTFGTIDTKIRVLPDRYEWMAVEARALGGRASLSGFIGRAGNAGWAVQINVENASVGEMTRGTSLESKRLEGRLNGFLSLARGGGADRSAIGAGWIDIDDAKLLELPVLLSVFNVLRLNVPGDSTVRACRTDFRVLDDRLHFDRFYVLSEGICLVGDGDVFLESHAVDLNFVPRMIGEIPLGVETVRDTVRPVTDFLSKNFLFDVEVKGTWTEPQTRLLPVRAVSKPLVDLLEWVLKERKRE